MWSPSAAAAANGSAWIRKALWAAIPIGIFVGGPVAMYIIGAQPIWVELPAFLLGSVVVGGSCATTAWLAARVLDVVGTPTRSPDHAAWKERFERSQPRSLRAMAARLRQVSRDLQEKRAQLDDAALAVRGALAGLRDAEGADGDRLRQDQHDLEARLARLDKEVSDVLVARCRIDAFRWKVALARAAALRSAPVAPADLEPAPADLEPAGVMSGKPRRESITTETIVRRTEHWVDDHGVPGLRASVAGIVARFGQPPQSHPRSAEMEKIWHRAAEMHDALDTAHQRRSADDVHRRVRHALGDLVPPPPLGVEAEPDVWNPLEEFASLVEVVGATSDEPVAPTAQKVRVEVGDGEVSDPASDEADVDVEASPDPRATSRQRAR